MRIAFLLGAVASIAFAGPAMAQAHHSRPSRSTHSDHADRSDRDDSYWGRHVDAYRDHRYGDPTVSKFEPKPAYQSPRDRGDDDYGRDYGDDDL